MNIILTVHHFLPEHSTGTELITYYLARELRRRGHDVTIVTASTEPGEGELRVENQEYDDFPVYRVRNAGDWRRAAGGFRQEYDHPQVGAWFKGLLKREGPDLVHFIHLGQLSASLLDACSATGTPCVFTATDYWAVCPHNLLRLPDGSICPGPDATGENCVRHMLAEVESGLIEGQVFAPAMSETARGPGKVTLAQLDPMAAVRARMPYLRKRFEQVARVLVPSQVMRETLIANGFDAKRICQVPYGIPADLIEHRCDKGVGARTPGPLRVAYIGQIAEHKGCHVLAEAVNLVPEVALEVRFHGDLLQDTRYVQRLEGLLAAGGGRMELAGSFEHKDVSRVLGGTDVLVCPSIWLENTPLVIYEAMAAGVPVVATDLPGLAEVVKPEVNGLLFPMGDAAALASILRRLGQERPVVARLAAQTEPPQSTSMHAARVEQIYHEVVGPRNGLQCFLETLTQEPVVVGRGTQFILEGWAFCMARRVVRLEVELSAAGGPRRRLHVTEWGNARPDVLGVQTAALDEWTRGRVLRCGFWCLLPLEASVVDRTETVRLMATLDTGEVLFSEKHRLRVKGSGALALRPLPARGPVGKRPRVCICMTTYNPSEEMLRRQIESIRAQDYDHWMCLIQDDWSSEAGREVIRRVVGDDARFEVTHNERNLGFFANFERVLGRVPADCQLVGLADQDDCWNPDKLSRLVAAFDGPEVTLAYSDMRIVDEEGGVVSKTYWATRPNNYTDMEALFFANTITGAASLFRAELLPLILPFPPRRGAMYHDWWIGLVALAAGEIRYVDAPLYDYYQHGGNVVGWSHIGRTVSVRGLVRSGAYRRELAHVAQNLYNHEGKFLASTIATLRQRVRESSQEAALKRLGNLPERPVATLLGQAWRGLVRPRASLNRERNVLMAHLVMRLLNRYFSLVVRANMPAVVPGADGVARPESGPADGGQRVMNVDTFERKCTPLTLEVRAGEPQRVNMLLATIDFRYFFGGYIGMFQLALRLAAAGCKMRLVVVEPCHEEMAQWRRHIQGYAGLEDFFDHVEVERRTERDLPLSVSPQDRWIATNCWTAWIADAAARQLDGAPFVFMIQEYEPYFVPHGTYYALSHAAYGLRHFALFSTELLRAFFRQERFGVYAASAAAGDAHSVAFQNAVLAFDVRAENLRRQEGGAAGGHGAGQKRKFLYYCRPEAHAQRNMFELGILALRQAIAQGVLKPAEWEFYGMGTVGEQFLIPLGSGSGGGRAADLVALPKMSLEAYASYLPDFDMGMSLMYTPHPSLVPLEMAAAGLVTVTNSFANKTAEALRGISTNFEVGEPTIEGLCGALARAAGRVGDIEARVAGSRIHWPTRWEEALGPRVMERLLPALGAAAVAPLDVVTA